MMHRKNHYPHAITRPIFSRVSFGLYTDETMILRTPSIHYAYTLLIQRYSGPTVSPATYLQEKHTRPSSLLAPTGYDYFTPPKDYSSSLSCVGMYFGISPPDLSGIGCFLVFHLGLIPCRTWCEYPINPDNSTSLSLM